MSVTTLYILFHNAKLNYPSVASTLHAQTSTILLLIEAIPVRGREGS
jgi:hypothetical protein